jgi:hypothetical protein
MRRVSFDSQANRSERRGSRRFSIECRAQYRIVDRAPSRSPAAGKPSISVAAASYLPLTIFLRPDAGLT